MAEERPELNRLEVLRGLRISNGEAVTSTAHLTLTSGAFQTGFALWLGANNLWIGVLAAIPTLSGLIQLFSSYFVERRSERKKFTALFAGAARLTWAPILLVPFVLPVEARLFALIILVLASNLLLNIPNPAYLSWLSDLIPADFRGRFFGRRNMVAGLTTMAISLPAAWFLDQATKSHRFPEAIGFGVIFGVATVCGLGSLLLLLRIPEPPKVALESPPLGGLRGMLAFYRVPFVDRAFRPFLVYSLIFAAGQFFAGPFYIVYALETLKLDYVWLQVFATLAGLSSLASLPAWGYLSDKFGPRPLLAIAVFGVALLPIPWIFTSRAFPAATIITLCLLNLAGGCFWAGVNLAQFNLLIGACPADRRALYVGAASAVAAMSGGIAPVIAGIVASHLAGSRFMLFGFHIGNYQMLFAVNAILRFLAFGALSGVRDPSAASAREVLTHIGPSQVGTWRHLRTLRGEATESDRRSAVHALGAARSALAVEELINALDDPSLHVREESAVALGEIADPRAAEALIEYLYDPASGIVDEAAAALGRIGDERAILPLARLLVEGEKTDRIAAARALGRLRFPESAEALAQAFLLRRETESSEVLEAIVASLGNIGSESSIPVLAGCLDSPSRTLRLTAVRALGEIAHDSAVPALLDLLRREEDPAIISHIAVAAAMIGAPNTVRPLLHRLDDIESPVARRQIVHAVGTLVARGDGFYRLLSADAFTRDSAVQKMIRELTDAPGSRSQRKSARADRLVQKYMSADYNEVVRSIGRLSRSSQNGDSAGSEESIRWVVEMAERRPITAEEALLALFAASNRA